jgi:maltose alpha-D-glucosyltransferase / alpha-amylase
MIEDQLWYKNAVFYEVAVRAFYDGDGDGKGDLRGLTSKLDYLKELGVDCLWLLPIFESPLKDDGYDIADYKNIHPDFGSLQDFKKLVAATHRRGMRIIIDLVLNHTSDQHPWFQAARTGRDSPYHDYYVWSDDEHKYSQARIIFVDTEKSNWSWDHRAERFYWHRFYSCQPDLNYDNPAVQDEMLDIVRFWLEAGVDGFRADAVPYLIEREGTNCENLPETHVFLKKLRRFIDEHYPGRILLCEANQWPIQVREYFGDGDEFHLGFHFPLMPRIFMSIQKSSVSPLVWVVEQTPQIPESCQWCTFLRNHDELTLEMVTEADRQWMWEQFAPEPRMRLNLGIRRRLAPLLENDQRRIELAYSLLFTLPGSPVIYYGDEIGMGDDIWLEDRDGLRTPMQWSSRPNAGFSTANTIHLYAPIVSDPLFDLDHVNVADQRRDLASLLNAVKKMIKTRKIHPVFGWGDFSWADSEPGVETTPVAAYWRAHESKRYLILNNLSPEPQLVKVILPAGATVLEGLLGKQSDLSIQGNLLTGKLEAYGYRWLRALSRHGE